MTEVQHLFAGFARGVDTGHMYAGVFAGVPPSVPVSEGAPDSMPDVCMNRKTCVSTSSVFMLLSPQGENHCFMAYLKCFTYHPRLS